MSYKNETINLLKETFGERVLSRRTPVTRAPRSWELTPLDYFLWGYMKSLVNADKLETIDGLEKHIWRVFADIRPQLLQKGVENWVTCPKSFLKHNLYNRASSLAVTLYYML